MKRIVGVILCPALGSALACGSGGDHDLFGNRGPASGGSGSGGGGLVSGSGGGSSPDAATTGGAGGSTPDGSVPASGGTLGGTGGVVIGDASPPESTGGTTTIGPPGQGFVVCGTDRCDLSQGQVCCIPTPPFLGTPGPPRCAASASGCDATWACDADNDCGERRCCFATQGNVLAPTQGSECRESCGSNGPFACSHPDDCDAGSVCCGRLAPSTLGTQAPYEAITCSPECPGSSYILCNTQDDCHSGGSCQQSNALHAGYSACF